MKVKAIKSLIRKYRGMGFSEIFCKEEYFVEEYREIFPGNSFSHHDIPKILDYYKKTDKLKVFTDNWIEALRIYNEEAEAQKIEKAKNAKVRNLNKDIAWTIISNGLRERGLQYAIEQYEYRMVVYVSILNKWQAEFSIVYSKFEAETCAMFDNVDKLIEIQSSGTPMCKLQKRNRRIKWENS